MAKPEKNQSKADLNSKCEEVEITSAEEISPFRIELMQMKERAATRIAYSLVFGYLFLITLCFVHLFAFGGTVAETVELIKTLSAVLLGTIGAVLGYYFSKA